MKIAYDVLLVIGLIVSVVFSALVFLTGKGDAMSGGGGVRTTFKGKAGFDDFVSRLTLGLGVSFMVLMLIVDMLGNRLDTSKGMPVPPPASDAPAPTSTDSPAPAPPPSETPAKP